MLWTEKNPLTTVDEYSFKGYQGTCRDNVDGKVKCTGAVKITPNSRSALMASIEKAPTSVAIDGESMSFQMYRSGIYDGTGE